MTDQRLARKRHDKRKRRELATPSGPIDGVTTFPELHAYVTIGFNSTTRCLETLAKALQPNAIQPSTSVLDTGLAEHHHGVCDPKRGIAAVFVPRAEQPALLHSHLPLLVKTASLASPLTPPVRLVSLPKGAEERLRIALGIPRVGLVGLLDGAPNATSLIDYVRKHVSEIEVPWLQEAAAALYLPVVIETVQTGA